MGGRGENDKMSAKGEAMKVRWRWKGVRIFSFLWLPVTGAHRTVIFVVHLR